MKDVMLIRANWFAVCDLAEVAPDTRRTPEDLVVRMRKRGVAHWTVTEIRRYMEEYEASLAADADRGSA